MQFSGRFWKLSLTFSLEKLTLRAIKRKFDCRRHFTEGYDKRNCVIQKNIVRKFLLVIILQNWINLSDCSWKFCVKFADWVFIYITKVKFKENREVLNAFKRFTKSLFSNEAIFQVSANFRWFHRINLVHKKTCEILLEKAGTFYKETKNHFCQRKFYWSLIVLWNCDCEFICEHLSI